MSRGHSPCVPGAPWWVLALVLFAPAFSRAEGGFIQLIGWGGGNPDDVVPAAAETGFSDIIISRHDATRVRRFVEIGERHGIGIYASISLADIDGWRKRRPGIAPPLQEMGSAENEALERIAADGSRGKSGYQYGGEPARAVEVLTPPLLCPHDPRVRELFQEQIREILSTSGIRGVAFDFFGYRNYRCCLCRRSVARFEAWREGRPAMPREREIEAFSLESLVDVINALAGHARSIRPDAKVQCHVYPVFLPEPLYGNRLDMDYCGQTAAWYFEPFWVLDKVRNYSRVIFGEEKRYFDRAEGVAFIGVYCRPDLYPTKDAARLAGELEAIRSAGGDRVQVCSLDDVLKDDATRAVFRRFFGR